MAVLPQVSVMALRTPRSSAGFTLIELLITVTIVAILSMAALPNFRTYIHTQNLKQSASQVESDLRTAQINAMGGTLSDEVSYWGIRFTSGSPEYSFVTSNSSYENIVDHGDPEALLADIVVRNDATIWFQRYTGDAFVTGGDSCSLDEENCVVYVGAPSDTICSRILVNSAGAILKEDDVDCSDL